MTTTAANIHEGTVDIKKEAPLQGEIKMRKEISTNTTVLKVFGVCSSIPTNITYYKRKSKKNIYYL